MELEIRCNKCKGHGSYEVYYRKEEITAEEETPLTSLERYDLLMGNTKPKTIEVTKIEDIEIGLVEDFIDKVDDKMFVKNETCKDCEGSGVTRICVSSRDIPPEIPIRKPNQLKVDKERALKFFNGISSSVTRATLNYFSSFSSEDLIDFMIEFSTDNRCEDKEIMMVEILLKIRSTSKDKIFISSKFYMMLSDALFFITRKKNYDTNIYLFAMLDPDSPQSIGGTRKIAFDGMMNPKTAMDPLWGQKVIQDLPAVSFEETNDRKLLLGTLMSRFFKAYYSDAYRYTGTTNQSILKVYSNQDLLEKLEIVDD